jgi:N-acetylglucosaminyl-diphospho-decaprenol L-rhamnosyltransferase
VPDTVQTTEPEVGSSQTTPAPVDIVVVSFNSRETLRDCVEDLGATPGLTVFVVDNASEDGTLDVVADLEVVLLPQTDNRGFSAGCNRGWQAGTAPYVLFLNPDARISRASVRALAATAEANDRVGVVAPRIMSANGDLEYSQRRFPALRSTFSQALFLHRLFRRASWADEVVRNPADYEVETSPDWVSGACLLVRRSVLEAIGGWDESFFLYSEDTDLCRRVRAAGFDVRFEPSAAAVHMGGRSSPRASLLPLLAESRIRYTEKHADGTAALGQRAGIALSSLTHLLVARSSKVRAGHAGALTAALRPPRR